MDEIIKSIRQAPELLQHIYSLEGAFDILEGLRTDESKAAYLIHLIAVVLYETSKAIDPMKVSHGPNDIFFHIMQSNDLFASFPYKVNIVDLGGFEDLYWAACAKTQELLHGADLMLANGFKKPHDHYLEYKCGLLMTLGPINTEGFKTFLLAQQSLLRNEALKTILNKGVIRKNMREKKHDMNNWSMNQRNDVEGYDEPINAVRHGIWTRTEDHMRFRHGVFQRTLGWLNDVRGLRDMSKMSCGMVFAEFSEKYQPMVLAANAELQVPQVICNDGLPKPYVSPYNLDERAKKLNNPDGPEMPCICDPDCMCVPLCASDLTQNCLCEENGLFARVTEGMDIDDLDVPDLVRKERQRSEAGDDSSAASSISAADDPPSDSLMMMGVWDEEMDQYQVHAEALAEIKAQKNKQIAQASQNIDYPGFVGSRNYQLEDILGAVDSSLEPKEYQFWEGFHMAPPRVSSLSYRDALVQPFSKLCDTPPRRISNRSFVTKRLFGSKGSDRRADKARLGASMASQSEKGITHGGHLSIKRTGVEVGFPRLKRAFRREPWAIDTYT